MEFSLNFFKQTITIHLAVIFFFLSLLFYSSLLSVVGDFSFRYDESWYSLMVQEFSENPLMVIPTLTGESVEWKPPLFFWLYSAFYLLFKNLPFSQELIMRLPSAIFTSAAVSMFFVLANQLYNRRVAIISTLLFMTVPLILFSAVNVMAEAISLLFIVSSMYFYVSRKFSIGSIFLALLILTKWLYVIAPLLFIVTYYLKDRELPKILLTFISIPLALMFYLCLSFLFGNIDNSLMNLTLDISRPVPNFNLANTLVFYLIAFMVLLPFPILFIYLIIFSKANLWEERSLIALSVLAFILPLSQHFMSWYLILAIPGLVLLVSKRLSGLEPNILLSIVVAGLMIVNILIFFSLPYSFTSFDGIEEVALFMKNKSVYFVEPDPFYSNWQTINDNYIGTNQSYLLLEQLNNGFLFYRFHDSKDYYNVHPVFIQNNGSIPCGDYLIVHTDSFYNISVAVPDCYKKLRNNSFYDIYTGNLDFSGN